MKKFALIVVLLFAFNLTHAQMWFAVPQTNEWVQSLAVYNGELYYGAMYSNEIMRWNGTAWSAVGTGLSGGAHSVAAMTVYNGELYVVGSFTSAGGNPANFIAKWNGTLWSAVGTGFDNEAYGLGVYNGELYASGQFTTAGGNPANHIARWNGASWSAVGTGISGTAYPLTAYSFAVYNGELYVGGTFTSAGGSPANRIAKWDGTNWSALGSGVGGTTYCKVWSLAVFNNELYAGGNFVLAGGLPASHIAKWNGTSWSSLGSGVVNSGGGVNNTYVMSLALYDSCIYAAGKFFIAGGNTAYHIAKWNGSNWSSIGGVHSAFGPSNDTMTGSPWIRAMAVYNSELYAGGNFIRVDDIASNYIAKWNSLPTGMKEDLISDGLNIFPSPVMNELYVNGYTLNEKSIVEIYDVTGEKVFSSSLLSPLLEKGGTRGEVINVSSLIPGIYFVRVTDEKENKVSKKFVKM